MELAKGILTTTSNNKVHPSIVRGDYKDFAYFLKLGMASYKCWM